MLRRSTGLSDERKRVGVSNEIKCASGPVKWRWVARARLSVVLSAVGSRGDVVGIGGLLEAIERRRELRGSYTVDAILDEPAYGEIVVGNVLHQFYKI